MAALSTHRFPPPRRGLMCKVFTRHNAGKVVTMTRNTSSNSTDDTAPWPCPGTTICPATAVPTARQSTQEMVQQPATGIIQGAFLQEGPGSDLSSPRWGREQTVEPRRPSYALLRKAANPSPLGTYLPASGLCCHVFSGHRSLSRATARCHPDRW